ncbi:MAG: V-type ATP synthase subunit F [Pseudomonadota bacterium]
MVEIPSYGPARLLFLGDATLTDGFRLLGFETWADPSVEQVSALIRELTLKRETALVLIDQHLAEARIPALEKVRSEGGRLLVIAVPSLDNPDQFHSDIEKQVLALTGQQGGTS